MAEQELLKWAIEEIDDILIEDDSSIAASIAKGQPWQAWQAMDEIDSFQRLQLGLALRGLLLSGRLVRATPDLHH